MFLVKRETKYAPFPKTVDKVFSFGFLALRTPFIIGTFLQVLPLDGLLFAKEKASNS